jgi:hypothetical protein
MSSTTIKITPEMIGHQVRNAGEQIKKSIHIGLKHTTQRVLAAVVAATPTDQGQMRNGWRVSGNQVINEAPHAGIVIKGARPHNVSRAGIESIIRWAMRTLGVSELEAKRIAWGKAANLRKFGQKPNDFITSLQPMFTLWTKEEVERQIHKRVAAGKL